eukprot:scaffold229557_cov51-Prasinocladus_malaysianus.AAC.3
MKHTMLRPIQQRSQGSALSKWFNYAKISHAPTFWLMQVVTPTGESHPRSAPQRRVKSRRRGLAAARRMCRTWHTQGPGPSAQLSACPALASTHKQSRQADAKRIFHTAKLHR